MNENAVLEKSMNFAVRIVKLSSYLRKEKGEYELSSQVLRSGTSIGANVREAQQGFSRRDFAAKLGIALKEAEETEYWLELLYRTELLTKDEYESIKEDSKELSRLLTSIVKTSRK